MPAAATSPAPLERLDRPPDPVASWQAAVELVARLPDEDRRRLLGAAKAHRRRQRDEALLRLSNELLGALNITSVAKLIDDATHGRRRSVQHHAVRLRLKAELGALDDIPGWRRIREIIENA